MATLSTLGPTPLSAVAIVAAAAMACLLFLRAGKCPASGRAVIAGTVAGLLIGATVAGRVLPDQYESLFIGGVKQREAVQYARWFAANVPTALQGMSEEARAAQRESDERQIRQKQAELRAARWNDQQVLRVFTMVVAAMTLLASTMAVVRSSDRRQGLITPLSIGIWSFALPGALAYTAALRWWEATTAEAAMLAAAVGIGPWAMAGAIERRIADDAEFGGARMMQRAGRIASLLAIGMAMWAAWKASSLEGAVLVSPLLALPAAHVIGSVRRSALGGSLASRMPSHPHLLMEWLIAMLAALMAIRIDLHISWTWTMLGMVVALGLLADDGRWLGALIGAMLPGGRSGLRTMRLVMPAMAAGPTQLAVAALATQTWLLPERFALPLLAGVILIEVTAPARRNIAAQLVEVESEIENDSE